MWSLIMRSEEVKPYIANRVKLLRGIRGLTLDEIAKQIGVSRKQVQNYENCDCAIPLVRLWQLANVMRVDINFFWDGINGKKCEIKDEDLQLIEMLNKIKDKEVKRNIIKMIKTLAEKE